MKIETAILAMFKNGESLTSSDIWERCTGWRMFWLRMQFWNGNIHVALARLEAEGKIVARRYKRASGTYGWAYRIQRTNEKTPASVLPCGQDPQLLA
jgi:hypothetical protein